MLKNITFLFSFIFAALMPPVFAGEVADAINAIADGEHRSEAYRARNKFRHPGETLEFFGIRPDMTVVELAPGGGGWYTEILAPYLKDQGTYYAGSYDPDTDSEYAQRNAKRYNDKMAGNPEMYANVKVTVFAPPEKLQAAPEGSADMVVTFRNMHSWMGSGNLETAVQAMYRLLKPGGVLGIVAHRGDPNREQHPEAEHGYIHEDLIIKVVEGAGFELDAKSEINANPMDTRDHPKGVWSLPPALSGGDEDREKYQAIGESDRMTLRFRKPAESA